MSTMKAFTRILSYARPYSRFWPGYLISSILSVIFGVVNYYTLMRTKIAPNVPGFLNRFTQKARVEDMSLLARDDLNKMRESFNLREKDIQAQESLIASKAIEFNTQSELIEQDRQNLLNAWSNVLSNQNIK